MQEQFKHSSGDEIPVSPAENTDRKRLERRTLLKQIGVLVGSALTATAVVSGNDRIIEEKVISLRNEIQEKEVDDNNIGQIYEMLKDIKVSLVEVSERSQGKFNEVQSFYDTLIDTVTSIQSGGISNVNETLTKVSREQNRIIEFMQSSTEDLAVQFSTLQSRVDDHGQELSINTEINEKQTDEINALKVQIAENTKINEEQTTELNSLQEELRRNSEDNENQTEMLKQVLAELKEMREGKME